MYICRPCTCDVLVHIGYIKQVQYYNNNASYNKINVTKKFWCIHCCQCTLLVLA